MVNFVIQPVDVNESAVTMQIFVDSGARNHGLAGILTMTTEEFTAFRRVMQRGVKGLKVIKLIVHSAFEAIPE
jgi:hypothetical protein